MTLLDKFRPDWKQSDIETRADAVRQLGASAVQTLTEIAKTDSEPKIRSLAIKKLEDPDLLLELHASESDEKVKEIAFERAASMLIATACGDDEAVASQALERLGREQSLSAVAKAAKLASVREVALSRLSETEVLVSVAQNADDTATRIQAVERIGDEKALLALALKESFGEVASAALMQLNDPEHFQAVAENGAVKTVRVQAQERLDSLPDEQHPTRLAEQREKQEQLIATAEAMADSTDWDKARDAIEEARSSWMELGFSADDELGQKFFAARERFIQNHREHLEALNSTDTSDSPTPTADSTSEAASGSEMASGSEANTDSEPEKEAAEPKDSVDSDDTEEPQDPELAPWADLCKAVRDLSGETIPEKLEAIRGQFKALGDPPKEAAKELESRFESVAKAAGERHAQWQALSESTSKREEICKQAEEAAQVEDILEAGQRFAALQKEWNDLDKQSPAESALEEKFAASAKALAGRLDESRQKDKQRKKDNLARITGLAKQLDNLLEAEDLSLRKAERALRDSQIAIRSPGPLPSRKEWPKLKKRLETAREALMPKFRQLEQEVEWKQWANVPIQEELCAKMEALIENEDLGHAAQQLRKLSEEWKVVASAPREKAEELWQRFRGAREKVRAKVSVYLGEQAEKRKENLKLKTALCEQAEALGDSTEWRETAEKLKELQARWKAIGPVPRKQSDSIWKRFRKPCDEFFQKRKAHFDAMDSERDANLKSKTALCEKAENLAESTDWELTTNKLKALQAEWKTIGPVPRKQSDEIWRRFRKACDLFFERRSRKDELPLEDNLAKRKEICAELEALLPSEAKPAAPATEEKAEEAAASPESDTSKVDPPKDGAEKTEAPSTGDTPTEEAEGAEAESAKEKEETSDESAEAEASSAPPENLAELVNQARSAWKTAGDVPRSSRAAIVDRYTAVSTRLMEAFPEGLEGTDLDPKAAENKRRKVCEKAESIVTKYRESQQEDSSKEPSIQDLAQQLKAALAANTIRRGAQDDSQDGWKKAQQELRDLERRWKEIPGTIDPDLAKRFEKAGKELNKLAPAS